VKQIQSEKPVKISSCSVNDFSIILMIDTLTIGIDISEGLYVPPCNYSAFPKKKSTPNTCCKSENMKRFSKEKKPVQK
jgi:hypothetical protein